ncbi:hypothetical protein D9M73_256440 [compost metagenome]
MARGEQLKVRHARANARGLELAGRGLVTMAAIRNRGQAPTQFLRRPAVEPLDEHYLILFFGRDAHSHTVLHAQQRAQSCIRNFSPALQYEAVVVHLHPNRKHFQLM